MYVQYSILIDINQRKINIYAKRSEKKPQEGSFKHRKPCLALIFSTKQRKNTPFDRALPPPQ